MSIRGLSIDGLKRFVRQPEVKTATLIYIHGVTPADRPEFGERDKLAAFLVDRGYLALMDLAKDVKVAAILLEDEEKLGARLSKLLMTEYALKTNKVGFKIYQVRDYASKEYYPR